ncbi:MAG: hypothetical protein AB8B79_03260 [Granulosicoccus sp.]
MADRTTLDRMIIDDTAQPYERLFDLPSTHSLKLSSSKQVKRDSMVFETRWLDEHDESQKLVARFRTWTNQSMKPPYRKQIGWERYSLSGDLLDREVRYSKRKTNDYLH